VCTAGPGVSGYSHLHPKMNILRCAHNHAAARRRKAWVWRSHPVIPFADGWIPVKRRVLTVDERLWLDKLLSVPLLDAEILLAQSEASSVVAHCGCGCGSIRFEVDPVSSPLLRPYPHPVRIPVQLTCFSRSTGMPVLLRLHVVRGYIDRIEVVRLDGETTVPDDLDVASALVAPQVG